MSARFRQPRSRMVRHFPRHEARYPRHHRRTSDASLLAAMEPAYDCATASQCKEGGMSSIEVPTRGEVEDLLYREAALLDGWQLEDWLELLTDDAIYQVP